MNAMHENMVDDAAFTVIATASNAKREAIHREGIPLLNSCHAVIFFIWNNKYILRGFSG
jgi:hypothetical protein